MGSFEIILVSISTMFTVFIILSALALLMHLISHLFPERQEEQDEAVFAAITTAHAAEYPNLRIKKIEEEQ